MKDLKTRRIKCPRCSTDVVVPLTALDGSGYLQDNFLADCTRPKCQQWITKENLGVRKLIRDIARNDEGTNESQFATYIAGSLFDPSTLFNYRQARAFKAAVLSIPEFRIPDDIRFRPRPRGPVKNFSGSEILDWEMTMVRKVNLSSSIMKQCFRKVIADTSARVLPRVFDAYVDDKPWSLDLVGAVLRQASFIQKMVDLKWTAFSSSTESEENEILLHAIMRYHRFMELLASSPKSFFVPTLDIDLAWHTHQIMPSVYKTDYLAYVGRFVNQWVIRLPPLDPRDLKHYLSDDKVETHKLSTSFDDTARAWKKQFGQYYTHCGCPKPGGAMKMELQRLLGDPAFGAAHKPPTDTDKLLNGTHRSDHPAVYTRVASDETEKNRFGHVAKHSSLRRIGREGSMKEEKTCPFGCEDLNQSVPGQATQIAPSDCIVSDPGFVRDLGVAVLPPNQTASNSNPRRTNNKRSKSRGNPADAIETSADIGLSFGGSCGGGCGGGGCGGCGG
ncbi:hypothetical protein V5O48_001999 [Marasmius crinis-equi]|uniref:Uncharacterized protein n=1 Tax=Marasmius crinis-equi TaxID=585013 RepID=A0ABR3FWS9_9AGAR